MICHYFQLPFNLKKNNLLRSKIFKALYFIILLFLNGHCYSSSKSEVKIVWTSQLKDTVHTLIDQAKKEILIAQFILIKDKSGLAFIEHLKRKALEGIKVKLIVDGVGAYSDVPFKKKDMQELVRCGIEVKIFHPKLKYLWKIKKRMHDKILWVDGKALLGSSSFWDVSFDQYQLEFDILVGGSVSLDIKKHFFEIWHSKEVISVSKPKALKEEEPSIELAWNTLDLKDEIMPVSMVRYIHDPVRKKKNSGSFKEILDLFKSAKRKIIIVNPYFLPTKKLRSVLSKLEHRGVEIIVYTNSPETLAKEYKMLGVAYSSLGRYLKKSGLTVYENNKDTRMIHSKYFVIDDCLMYVGSQNLDYLGANHNTENGIIFESKEFYAKLQVNLLMIKNNSFIAYKDGQRIRSKYKIGNPFKKVWRHILVFFFKGVL